ncbi:UDP-4-amino-4,6-dideoxy-N-acetyl-beta-L-altrosamine transaminase [Candidatus Falkowbacteria bacterium CG1_02_37_44]|uniref:UDP-4-amino-4, 6-dideoxy-N-acetyl-beta-L-altrosamine transaminase n=1 Tax=Candidatus Falkowbacteria bacterium CG1_02_37_44 TaxID=1805146 RepID=A0A1J4TET1_9BACT|nr:MAG: UDP-4-amino-4,6-dideoxy-N-acetyl-beta-L-altrosamine transaminase [Candidatus Falkowbacteria bacterium CG1_02_37_44]PIX11951.1 MAG: UDP-4-amino-4,6-dideoxy-N-acetyl-beta-L-altrosamine transaminase [Candidatus Falkowbacteria bacterium CG_4_8_14_3_um_filter_36_11]
MLPYGKQYIDKSDISEVVKVLQSDFLTQGPKVKEFEESLAKYCGAKYAVACANGTAALHLAYLAAGIKKGDEAITTPNTFAATANMLMAIGAKPVFCDIRSDTYNIDEENIKKLITKRTKVIVQVHFAGQSCEMKKIKKIAKKHKLIIIEDACHALGGKYEGEKIGSCKYSDMAIFSFHPVKSITTGEGGAVLTNNKKYYEKLLSFRSHGIHKDKNGKNVMVELGYNYRITDIQCALGISQLKKLDKFIKERQRVVKWYEEELGDFKKIILPNVLPENYSSWHIYVIRTAKKNDRDKLKKYLQDKGIGVNFHYPAVYSHPYYRNNGYKNIRLKNMEEYHTTCITLPCYTQLERKDIKYIGEVIREFFKK